jgi:hypothetical protein
MAADREKHSGLRKFAPRLTSAANLDLFRAHRSCHEVEQELCHALGSSSQKEWPGLPEPSQIIYSDNLP